MKNKVPSPWTPIEFEFDTKRVSATVWGRKYVWDGTLLPSKIVTNDREILSSGAVLHAAFTKKGGGFDALSAEEEFTSVTYTPISADEDKAVFIAQGTAGNIIVNVRYTVEYDGYVEMAMSVIPFWSFAGDFDNIVRLSGLYLEFPLTEESSDLFHYWPNGESGLIPDKTIMASGAVTGEGIECPFKPYFWAGWEFGGLGIATETDENIELSPGTPVYTLKRTEKGRTLRINLLNKMPHRWFGRADSWIEALAPIDYIFGIQATPVKELFPDRMKVRAFYYIYDQNMKLLEKDDSGKSLLDKCEEAGVNWFIFHERWSAIQNYGQAACEEDFKTLVGECHKRGMKVMGYFGYEYPTNAPQWHEKKDDYLVKTPSGNLAGGWQRKNPYQRAYIACYAGGYAEGLRERVKYAMEHYGFDGIYTDGTYVPWECANAAHGCGYTDGDGVRHTTYPIFAVRRHVKALYELVHEKGGMIDTHQSTCLMAPTLAFADSFYNGESIQPKLRESFMEFLNLPAFRTEYMGKNIGVFPQLIASDYPDLPIEKTTSLSLIHDVLPRPGGAKTLSYISKFWKALDEFDSGRAVWHPYWKEDGPIKVETENVFCSVYEKDGRYLAAVSSFNEEADEIELSFKVNVSAVRSTPGNVTVNNDGNRARIRISPFCPELIEFTAEK